MTNSFEKNIYYYLILSMIIWGISWPTSKVLTFYSDTYTLLFLKFLLSTLSLVPVIVFFAKKSSFTFKLVRFIVAGVFTLVLYNVLFFLGIKVGYAGVGGVIVTTTNPLITLILMAYLDNLKIGNRKKLALILGLCGGFIMLEVWDISYDNLLDSGNIFFIISSFTWSILTIISSRAKDFMGSLMFTFYLYIFSTIFSLFFINIDNLTKIFEFDYIFWSALVFTTIISSGFATGVYFKASTLIGASNASSFLYLVPLVALFSSSFLIGEIPHTPTIVGGVLSIFAIYLLNKK